MSQLVNANYDPTFKCTSCHAYIARGQVGSQQNGYCRCRACKRYDRRLAKGVKAATPEEHKAWQNTSAEERRRFKASFLADSGIDQKTFNAKLAAITVCSEASTRNRPLGKTTGYYVDSPDLAKKFEG